MSHDIPASPTIPRPIIRRFSKILIANRGEIACRIFRTARRLGLSTVAVYSDADRDALHVEVADEAYPLGPAPARDSYLVASKLIAAAHATGAEAVHPGYGFLSENAGFADACAEAGLVFIGPSGACIRTMGSKAAAKTLMATSGAPLVPGYHETAQDLTTLTAAAARIGYPVLIKASAGGGGKGMRIVTEATDLAEAIESCKAEARAAFGDDHVLIEKYLQRPRHIEVQIFGDTHGNIVSLFERECTLQRRHQKVVEEAPSSAVDPQRRETLMSAARAAGKAIDYVGAGTVEFVANESAFYFIEMNTRLQVEHPVTEMITGQDLVEWQLRVAMGEALPLSQASLSMRGHAMEARIYAEDADKGFLPSIGTIVDWQQPTEGDGVRIDTGFRRGASVSPHYDPMLAKLIVWGESRAAALAKIDRALGEFQIAGVATNIAFLRALIRHPASVANAVDTGFIERELAALTGTGLRPGRHELAAAVSAVLARIGQTAAPLSGDLHSPWQQGTGWTLFNERRRPILLRDATGREHATVLHFTRRGLLFEYDGQTCHLETR
jgi:3-methylcrotonyl-CoA carboxylase alpha subunit